MPHAGRIDAERVIPQSLDKNRHWLPGSPATAPMSMTRAASWGWAAVALALGSSACATGPTHTPSPLTPPPVSPAATVDPGVLAPRVTTAPGSVLPALATRQARLAGDEAAKASVLLLDEPLDANQQLAQDLAVHDPRVLANLVDTSTGLPLRAEVLGVYPARAGDLTDDTAVCRTSTCYRVELYNHATNSATVTLVDVPAATVLAVNDFAGFQPDIPPHLVALAREIAVNAPEVAQALGFQPAADEAVMAGTKTALNETSCERSRHLCVAPTFVQGDRALWAIVDLTDGVLVGTRWTALGKSGTGPVVTEKHLQDDVISALYCEHETPLTHGDWTMTYMLTSSDGLRLSDVTFRGRPVLDDAKLVDWHVSYSGEEAFGYSDAIGCPTFSQAAVVAHEAPSVTDIAVDGQVLGFSITQDFEGEMWPAPCNYYYRQRFDFYDDGRFRTVAANVGRGCGDQGTYRPVLRIGFAGADNSFASWDGAGWQTWSDEGYALQGPATEYSPEGYQFRVADTAGAGYYVQPGQGQFGDGGRGDNAFTYVTLNKPGVDEGQADLITIGPCCNADHQQGPEKFMLPAPDPIAGSHIVMWYVPQLQNDDTPGQEYCWADTVLREGVYVPVEYPCYAGPMFVPIGP
jgi:hypothetical protein